MMPKYINRHAASAHGFTMIEIMVVFAVIGIMIGLAVPNVQNWRRNYNVKSAVTDLYANMQLARIGAIRNSRPWTMTFQSGAPARYEVRDANYDPMKDNPVKRVELAARYHGNIVYGSPDGSGPIDNPTITFNPSGVADNGDGFTAPGFVYLKGANTPVYYRVGIRLTSSAARIQRWDGSTWR